MTARERMRQLYSAWLLGRLDEPGAAELHSLLQKDLDARRDILDDLAVHGMLRQLRAEEGDMFARSLLERIHAEESPGRFYRALMQRRKSSRRHALRPTQNHGLRFAAWAAALAIAAIGTILALRKDAPPPRQDQAVAPPPTPRPERPERPRVPDLPPLPPQGPPPATSPEPPPLPQPKPPVDPPPGPKEPAPPSEPRESAVMIARVERPQGDQPITSGHVLDLGPAETATIVFTDSTRLELSPNTKVQLEEGASGKHVILSHGELTAVVPKQPADRPLVFTTPHAKATVLGTRLRLAITPDHTLLRVLEGRVRVAGDSASIVVSDNHYTVVAPGEPLTSKHCGRIWIDPATSKLQAPMTPDRRFAAGSLTNHPVFADIDNRTLPDSERTGPKTLKPNRDQGGWVTVEVDVPETDEWYLWGRFLYPGGTVLERHKDGRENDPNSFYVSVDGGQEKIFGNLRYDPETRASWFARWHWDGDGNIEIGKPAPLPLGRLDAGRHTLRIRNRDAVETESMHLSPRLDLVCLTSDCAYVPRDADAQDK